MTDLLTRARRALPGWRITREAEGWHLLPERGPEALIRTDAAFEEWLRHQERWGKEKPVQRGFVFEEAA